MSLSDDLFAEAAKRAAARITPEEWGYRIDLAPGEHFDGTWIGETVDEEHDNRVVYLLRDASGEPCWSRSYAALTREFERLNPQPGWLVVIVRGDDYTTGNGTGYAFGAAAAPPSPSPIGSATPHGEEPAADEDMPFRWL